MSSRQAAQHQARKQRLAAADFGNGGDYAFFVAGNMKQCSEHAAALAARKEEIDIGRDLKRRFFEVEVLQIESGHGVSPKNKGYQKYLFLFNALKPAHRSLSGNIADGAGPDASF
jgi:hypothetical protein